ncbi:hypothetical protein HBF18_05205, partial [Streptococcus pneumoniae]|nr:hypothetical protein [Streptococcus pneumoniae]
MVLDRFHIVQHLSRA